MYINKTTTQNKLKTFNFCAMLSIFLSGCVTPYTEPTTGQKATIQFVNDTPHIMGLNFYDGADECTDRKIGRQVSANSNLSVVVPANGKVAFTAAVYNPSFSQQALVVMGGAVGAVIAGTAFKSCQPTLDFKPENGKKYIFHMKPDAESCIYNFYDSSSAPMSVTIREVIRPMGEAGPFCKK